VRLQTAAADFFHEAWIYGWKFVFGCLHDEHFIVNERILVLIHGGHAFLIGGEVRNL